MPRIAAFTTILVLLLSSCISTSLEDQQAPNSSDESTRFIGTISGLLAEYPNLRLKDATASQNCEQSDLARAVRRQGIVYDRLSRARGAPRVDREIARAVAVQSAIPDNTGVLFYHKTADGHCVWLLDADGVNGFASIQVEPGTAAHLLALFYESEGIDAAQLSRAPKLRDRVTPIIDDGNRENSVVAGVEPVLEAMSYFLIPGDLSEKLLQYQNTVIVPYDSIGTFPFAALPLGNGQHLIEFTTIQVAPSLVDLVGSQIGTSSILDFTPSGVEELSNVEQKAYWRWLRTQQLNGDNEGEGYVLRAPRCTNDGYSRSSAPNTNIATALIIGDPDYSQDPEFEMPQLAGARREAVSVSRIFRTDPLLGEQATLAAVEEVIADVDLLYFATHAISYRENGLKGFLALSEGERLTAKSVQEMCLSHAKIAVLSACQTGLGQTVEGGTIGLSRAFQIAGVEDVVMSLWNVDDEATRILMTRFSMRVRAGDEPKIALQKAILATKRVYASPRYWASFAVFSPKF